MPQLTGPIAIVDSAAVSVSFGIEQKATAKSVFVDRRLATRNLQPVLTAEFDPATAKRNTYRVKRGLVLPIVRTVNGVDSVVDNLRIFYDAVIPTAATALERANAETLMNNFLINAILKAGVRDLDPII